MRLHVLAVACAACTPPPVPPPAPIASYDAYVIDPVGLVAGATVDVVRLPPRACPCGSHSDDRLTCSCPAAIPMWRSALDHCARPAPLASVRADDRGHVLVPAIPGTTLVATGPRGEAWTRAPALQTPIALELATNRPLHATIDARAEGLHAALVWDSGRCVPLRRDADGTWVPTAPIDADDSRVVVAANADGFAIDDVPDGNDLANLAIYPTRAESGECPAGTTAHLDGAFQHLTARVDANGTYTFPQVLGITAHVTCVDNISGAVLDESIYDPKSNAIEGTLSGSSMSDDECIPIDVTDQTGRAVADATISSFVMSGNFGTGTGGVTDAHGHGCTNDYANELHVDAPFVLGGQCAGHEELELSHTQAPHQSHIPITLHIRELPRVVWRGRVVTPEGVPVAGALVRVEEVHPAATPDCYDRADSVDVHTALDGTFTLPALPRGKITLAVHHAWYLDTDFVTATTGPTRDIVVGRGGTWTGRVLDPDGHPIDQCQIFVTKPNRSLELVECTRTGFALSVLPQGTSEVEVRLHHHALGDLRSFVQNITFAANEHRVADIRWPPGETIAGVIVDANGVPIPNARIVALPKRVKKVFADRIDDAEVQVLADTTGHFTFHHLEPGLWVLGAGGAGRRRFDVATGTLDARITNAR